MKLKGRNLSSGTSGEDVKLLHSDLARLDYKISLDETQGASFGKTTLDAVIDFQKANGLQADGIVGSNTARLLDLEIARLQPKPDGATKPPTPVAPQPPTPDAPTQPTDKPQGDGGPKSFVIQGQVRQRDDKPAVGMTVRAFEHDNGNETQFGETVTDAGGQYKITYTEEVFHKLSGANNGFDVIMRVFDVTHTAHAESNIVRITKQVETIDQKIDWLPWTKPEPPQSQPFRVTGQVRWFDGRQATNLTVRAFDKDLRSEELLGASVIDTDGYYDIGYGPEQFRRAEKGSADLIVRVFDQQGTALDASHTVFNAREVETIDLVLGGSEYIGPSEYEQIIAQVTPILQDIQPADLSRGDMAFLSGETGINQDKLELWIIANIQARSTGLPAEFFYGVARQNVPGDQMFRVMGWFTQGRGGASTSLTSKAGRILSLLIVADSVAVIEALQASITENIVSQSLKERVEELRRLWEDYRRIHHSSEAIGGGPVQIDGLLGLATLGQNARDAFLALYRQKGEDPEFWNEVKQLPGIDEGKALDLQATFMVGDLVDGDLPLVTALKKGKKEFRPEHVKALAKWDAEDWEGFLNKKSIKPPASVFTGNGSDTASRAASLTSKFEQAFPTNAFVGRLEKDSQSRLPERDTLISFLNLHPNMELLNTNLEQYFQDNRERIAAEVKDVSGFKEKLQDVQRVLKLAPSYTATETLIGANVRSAQHIYFMGVQKLRETVANNSAISEDETLRIYHRAEYTYSLTLALVGELKSMANGSAIVPLSDAQTAFEAKGLPNAFPTWESLFGSADLCECEHCRSVYGPAAYMVDILRFLRDRVSTTPGKSVQQVLLNRRPDIGEIELSCANTNIALPYIDLVCEILEDAAANNSSSITLSFESQLSVTPITGALRTELAQKGLPVSAEAEVTSGAPQTWFIRDAAHTYKITKTSNDLSVALSHQTHGTTAELQAQPEYVNFEAYKKLKTARFPMALPFDLFLEEARAYLDKINVKRDEAMRLFQNPKNKSAAHPQELDIAAEFLGFSKEEADIIDVVRPDEQATFWGNLNSLEEVTIFLEKTGLEYKQLLDLLELNFINPNRDSQIEHKDDTCNLSAKAIKSMADDPHKLDRVHRFLRLWRRLGWTMWELDRVVMCKGLGKGEINEALFIQLPPFIMLKEQLSLSVEELLSFYEAINTDGDTALYNRIFLNKALLNPVDDAFKLETLAQASGTETIKNHAATFQAVLKLSAQDIALLGTVTNDKLELENISRIYRYALLAIKLNLPVEHLLATIQLLETPPAKPGVAPIAFDPFENPARTLDFVSTVRRIRSSGFSAVELNYILKHIPDASLKDMPTTDKITDFITEMRQGLQSIKDANETLTGAPGEDCRTKLSMLQNFEGKPLEQAIAIIDGSWKGNDDERDKFISERFALFLNADQAKQKLKGLPPLTDKATDKDVDDRNKDIEARFVYVLASLNRFFALGPSRDFVTQKIGAAFGLPDDFTRSMLDSFRLQGMASSLMGLFLISDLLKKLSDGSGFELTIAPAIFQPLYDAYVLLDKAVRIINRLSLGKAEVEWLNAEGAAFGLFGLSALPVNSSQPDLTFDAFDNLKELTDLRKAYPGSETNNWQQVLNKVVQPGAEKDFFSALSALTGWPLEELTDTAEEIGISYPDGFKSMETYGRLGDCIAFLHSLDIAVGDVAAIITPDFTPGANSNKPPIELVRIKQIAKGRYENAEWLAISKNIQDVVREKKRDALVAYLLANPVANQQWKDANDLYSYFLIDVEMSACDTTTRILQANLSMQIFVQRCLMRLEQEVIADAETSPTSDPEWKQWKWMRLYRLWEANRKVFLYPENWIEPELRSDKSPFFKELEGDLLQNELTHANAENAYTSYLEKLDTVARLDVRASYYEEATYTLHVFARTYDDPYVYYYRRLVEDSYWTAWEKVDADIKSDHLIPLVINRRLYLYWAEFTEQAIEKEELTIPSQGDNTFKPDKQEKYWEIRLAISEYRSKKWTGKKVSKSFLKLPSKATTDLPPRTSFFFMPLDLLSSANGNDGGKFLIACFYGGKPDYQGAFELGGCHGTPEVLNPKTSQSNSDWETSIRSPKLISFNRDMVENIELAEITTDHPLTETGEPDDSLAYDWGTRILGKTPGQFRTPLITQLSFLDKWWWELLNPSQIGKIGFMPEEKPYSVGSYSPFFYKDQARTFFVHPQIVTTKLEIKKGGNWTLDLTEYSYTELLKLSQLTLKNAADNPEAYFIYHLFLITVLFYSQWNAYGIWYRLRFSNFYHPYVCYFIKQLYLRGIDGLLKREVQLAGTPLSKETTGFKFAETYDPQKIVYVKYPFEYVDFEPDGSYSLYNWELFFHAPLLIATRLSQNQRFEEAMQWFHYIFNPTDTSSYPSPNRYWITQPFFIRSKQGYFNQRVDQLLNLIANKDKTVLKQVEQWRNDPFNPHLIAMFRTVAYQKTVVMKYLDNLIAWGDQLFKSDTRENINEATQLYILAAEILGPRPKTVPPQKKPPVRNYQQLENDLDKFGNALMHFENFTPPPAGTATQGSQPDKPKLPRLDTLYFCIPQNDKLLEYWDTVADRLFKIRHCMNIEGVVRQLALFDPPIDPALLVRAAAAGLDLGTVLSDINAPLPPYRYQTMAQKAQEFCNDVKALGSALLAALEKRDAEALALLRSSHEQEVLGSVLKVKEKQVEEAEDNLEVLGSTLAVVVERKNYYAGLSYMNPWEIAAFGMSGLSTISHGIAMIVESLASATYMIPDITVGASGFGGSPEVVVKFGGDNMGKSGQSAAEVLYKTATLLDKMASLSSTQGAYQRRQDEWDFQQRMAEKEMAQINKQVVAATVRRDIAIQELSNQQLQIEKSKAVDEYLHSKFTNQELYDWMIAQIAAVYFQSYQLAYDMAKKAERCFQNELGLTNSSFIQFGHWDSMKKGLMAGERLSHELRRMEAAYLDQNRRELEITKHISLSQLDPVAFLQLKQTGQCFVKIPEALFDLDYPGHYLRRLKSVRVTIPCVIGPYTSINCTLTMTKSSIRRNTSLFSSNPHPYLQVEDEDSRFTFNTSIIQSIATSNAQNDGGLFELNLRDERYLPFEGSGVISEWHIELPEKFRQFDYDTISDVILHFSYTARDGGKPFRDQVTKDIEQALQTIKLAEASNGLAHLFSARHEFQTQWHSFLMPGSISGDQTLTFDLGKERFPLAFKDSAITFNIIELYVKVKSEFTGTVNKQTLRLSLEAGNVASNNPLNNGKDLIEKNGLLQATKSFSGGGKPGNWTLAAWLSKQDNGHTRFSADAIEDILIVCYYSIASKSG